MGEAPKVIWKNDAAHDGWLRQIAVSPDGARIATCGLDQFVRVWDAAAGKKIAEHKCVEDVYALTFDPGVEVIVLGSDLLGAGEDRDQVELRVEGSLVAVGTAQSRIVMRTFVAALDPWFSTRIS